MNFNAALVTLSLVASLSAAETPKIFSGYFEKDVPVKAQIGMVLPPPEIDKYVEKVQIAARKDPKWFLEFSSKAKPGVPLPYDAHLGLTQAEYDEYILLWNKRQFRPAEEVILMLRQSAGSDVWSISATGGASLFSTLRYSAKDDSFRSPNGPMKRIEDIKADADGVLGEWSGSEWKFEEETSLGKTKESFALGQFADHKFGILVYRAQEQSTEGTRLLDKSVVVRFALGQVAQVKESTTAAKPAPKK
jgi:hypothetical protein